MSENTKILIRNARDQDIPAVIAIDAEAFSSSGTAEKPETFQLRLTAFPEGFLILIAENEIAAYGCCEKWLTEHEPGADENPVLTHQPDGRILCITALAVKTKYRGRGYGLVLLDKFIEIARRERCLKIVSATTQAPGLFGKRGFKTVRSRTQRGISWDVMALDLPYVASAT